MRRFALATVTASLSVLLAVAAAELAIRLLVKPTPIGLDLMSLALAPNDWDALRTRMSAVWAKGSGDLAFQVYDAQLGWVLGPNRRSANGLYFSSPEGIRSSGVGEALATREPKRRIAIVGDSFAFGEEVSFQDTFPVKLEEVLGEPFQVLNFGVPGYGVDQAYLRYRKDVLAWNPEIVVLAFPSHDLIRTMGVYTFVNFPGWDMPFSKPRAMPTTHGLDWINVPTLHPEQMFKRSQVSDLPFLKYEIGYEEREWNAALGRLPYFVRFLIPRLWHHLLPPTRPNPNRSAAVIFATNEVILRDFVRLAREQGSIPIIAYLPGGQVDFDELRRTQAPAETPRSSESADFDPRRATAHLGRTFLRSSGIHYFDTTPCVSAVNPAERFTSNNPHLSAVSNAAVGQCLGRHIRQLLDQSAAPGNAH